jgi:hypothetical protein
VKELDRETSGRRKNGKKRPMEGRSHRCIKCESEGDDFGSRERKKKEVGILCDKGLR